MTSYPEVCALVRKAYQIPREAGLWPAAQPKSMVRLNIREVFRPRAYVVSQKADGEHRALVLGQVAGTPFCGFLDRCEAFVSHQVRAPFGLFAGTLLLGELVGTDFLIFDLVQLAGTSYLHGAYPDRMAAAARLVTLQTAGSFVVGAAAGATLPDAVVTEPVVRLVLKPFYYVHEFAGNFVPVTPLSDGLIFMPAQAALTRAQPFKWKEQEAHTVDLKILAGRRAYGDPWSYRIVEPDCAGLGVTLYFEARCPLMATLEGLLGSSGRLEYAAIFECSVRRDPVGGHTAFVPIKIRVDKLHGNSWYTVQGTLHSVNDNISRHELIQHFMAATRSTEEAAPPDPDFAAFCEIEQEPVPELTG